MTSSKGLKNLVRPEKAEIRPTRPSKNRDSKSQGRESQERKNKCNDMVT